MKRTLITVLLAALAAIMVANSAGLANAQKVGHSYNFEETSEPWTARADMGYAVKEVPIQLLTAQPHMVGKDAIPTPDLCAGLTNPGGNAVWMQTALPPEGDTIHIEYDVMNLSGGKRLTPIIYVGMGEPSNLYDFQKLGMPLEKDKQHLYYDAPMGDPDCIPFVTVAVGFMNLDGVQKEQVAGIDNVQVTIYDR